jgi:hypothetical protein
MNQSSKNIISSSLASLVLASAPWVHAGVRNIGQDFEAKLSIEQDGIPAVPVSVTVVVASATTAPKFSGRVVSGSVSLPIAGSFAQGEDGYWTASVRGLKGVPGFDLVYSQPIPETEEGGPGFPDALSVRLVIGGVAGDEVYAKPAVFLDNDADGKAWEWKHAIAGAIQTNPTAFDELDAKIEAVVGRLSDIDSQISSAKVDVAALTAESKSAEATLAAAVKAASGIRTKASALTAAYASYDKAEDSLDKLLVSSSAALDKAIVAAGVLTPDELTGLSEFGETPGQALLSALKDYVDQRMGEGDSNPVALKQVVDDIAAIANAANLTVLDDKIAEARFGFISMTDFAGLGETQRLSVTKSFWKTVSGQVGPLNTAYQALQTAEGSVLKIEETLQSTPADSKDPSGPSVLDALVEANSIVNQRTEEAAQAKQALAALNDEIAGYEATKAAFVSSRAMLTAAKQLSGFAGYGTFSGAVTGAKYNAKAPIPVVAAMAGTTPDGQKFSSSSKLRANLSEDLNGVFHVNGLAGKNPLVLEVGYSVDGESKTGSAVQQAETQAFWAGLTGSQIVGSALFPPKVLDADRPDNGRAINIFGGPLDEDSVVSLDPTAATTVVVSFGEENGAGPTNGFGALVSNANKVNRLLVARKGATFTLTPSLTVAPLFSGVYPFASGTAKPSPYSGVFMKVEGDSGTEVKGFGSLVASATVSAPVVVSSNFTSDVPTPVAPAVPVQPPVVWTGFAGGSLSFTLSDMPDALNLTTLVLYKGQKEVGRAVVTPEGVARIPSKGLVAGGDYSVKVLREVITGSLESEPSEQFSVSTKALPPYTYQALLGPSEGETARNGLPYQGRLTVTTTATGSWSGSLQWVSLTQVRDVDGNLQDGYIPTLKTLPLKGQLVDGTNPESPSDLIASVTIPSVKNAPGHSLQLVLKDEELPESVFGFPALPAKTLQPASTALELKATFSPDSSEGENGAVYVGSGMPAVSGVAGKLGDGSSVTPALAKGKFTTASWSGQAGAALGNHSHVIDYAGASVATYTFQNGALGKLTGSCNVLMDGSIPVLAVGVVGKYSLSYTNTAATKPVTVSAPMALPMALAAQLVISKSSEDTVAGKAVPRYRVQSDEMHFAGCELEVASKVAGGHVYRSAWADGGAVPRSGFGSWMFSDSTTGMLPTKRFQDFSEDEKLTAVTEYSLEIVEGSGSNVSPLWTGGVTFTASGAGTAVEFASLAVAKRPVSISWAPKTGVMTATVTVRANPDGSFEFNPATGGKAVKLTGFALPNSESLIGWGGIEGGNLSWRLRTN